jgi:hypothetical protein
MDYNALGDFLIRLAAVIGAIGVIFGVIFGAYRWYLRQNRKQREQDADIARIKAENCLICYGLSACLDGLMQLGANHSVPDAKEKLDKYLNQQAHK